MCPSYPTSASGRTLAKPSGIIGIGYRNHSRTYTVWQYPKTNHSTEFQWKISNNSVTKCNEAIFSFLQCRACFWFSHNIFERTESAYSRVGHVNYGQLGNRLVNLWINGPLGLGWRVGGRLSYPARHTPLSPTLGWSNSHTCPDSRAGCLPQFTRLTWSALGASPPATG